VQAEVIEALAEAQTSGLASQLQVGAVALAHRRANAVGAVRLACRPDGLHVDLVHAGRFVAGFALASTADAVSFTVPYRAIRGLVRDGELLHLSLDPSVAQPYNRFALARFSHDPHGTLLRAFEARNLATILRLIVPPVVATLAGWLVPMGQAGGVVGRVALAAVVGWLCWQALSRFLDGMTWGGPQSDALRDVFEMVLEQHLGLGPTLNVHRDPLRAAATLMPAAEATRSVTLADALGVGAKPRLLAMATGAAVAVGLIAFGVVQNYGVAEQVLLPVDVARTGLRGPIRALASNAAASGTPQREFCNCERVDSTLWGGGLPQLSIVALPSKGVLGQLWLEPGETYQIGFTPGPPPRLPRKLDSDDDRRALARRVEDGDNEVELEIAIINNGELTLDTVDLVVTFARRDASGGRHFSVERGLHWPATLEPGEAVKWTVEGKGSELRVDSRYQALIGESLAAAPADAFYELRNASLSAVRVHGAVMLAYLGDPRAGSVIKAFGPLRGVEERALDDLRRLKAPLRACDRDEQGDKLSLCLFNASDELARGVRLQERGTAEPRSWTIDDLFVAGRGLRVSIEAEPLPRSLEVVRKAAK
jgi:hypothetical protein